MDRWREPNGGSCRVFTLTQTKSRKREVRPNFGSGSYCEGAEFFNGVLYSPWRLGSLTASHFQFQIQAGQKGSQEDLPQGFLIGQLLHNRPLALPHLPNLHHLQVRSPQSPDPEIEQFSPTQGQENGSEEAHFAGGRGFGGNC